MKKMFVIEHPTFDMETLVAIGATDEDVEKWIKKNTTLEVDEEFLDFIACPGFGRTVVHGSFSMLRMPEWKNTNRNFAHLAHEAFHLAEMTYQRIGIKHDVETSGEAYAYFIQHTVDQILDALK